MDIYHEILQRYWGYTSFRPMQEDIIHSISEGKDTLGLMPTGGGKSLTFQVPAMTKEGVCLVVTPLIALMKDQVDNLRDRGIRALAVYTGMTRQEIITTLENAVYGDYKFLYVSPERLASDIFIAKLKFMNISMIVVDEAHCISQWGYDFRPSYLQIAGIRELLPDAPVLALTATATPEVVDDIQERLNFKEKNVFKTSFSRSNLAYLVRQVEDKTEPLVNLLNRVQGSTIVYVRSRQKTKEIAEYLQKVGFSADYFHAGLLYNDKIRKQNAWKNDECRIIVSTNAFGMGIDKPNVRLVVHMDLPNSLEEYFQEAGRAGRDGEKAYAVILYVKQDSSKLKKRIVDEFPDRDFILKVYDSLAYYCQVADGAGMGMTYDFNLKEFCGNYKLPMIQVHSALKLLTLAGYIEYSDEIDNRSRLMFKVYRDDLYHYRFERDTDNLINIILRLYTGLFADYANIDEESIASKAGVSRKHVYETLKMLSKQQVLDYIPHKKTPLVTYTHPRIESKYVRIPRLIYEDRKSRFEKRIQTMSYYAEQKDQCRSRILLTYFGESDAKDCGYCDVCLAKNDSGLTNKRYNAIADSLKDLLKEKDTIPIHQIIANLSMYRAEDITTVIRFEIEKGNLALDLDKIRLSEN
ncbi:RecQ family ATP-dependent DNA helicase [Dysgonomonas massiliensis]|uniref:RecQ family ATP-dependent DNA helicase n=1 Tax=Dysgonomonas massiliensis TaxID=2040292 RepID=UPI000C78DDDB|nr:ATP-dependent DNA helicase RecQ [Dysgonomonas massiliensis]